MQKLPQSVQEIADVIGPEKTLTLIKAMGHSGRRPWRVCFYVPKKLPDGHRLIKILGKPAAMALCREFAGMILQPSNCQFIARNQRNRKIHRLAKQGFPTRTIAKMVQVSQRHIYNILRRDPPPEAFFAVNDNLGTE